MLKLGRLSLDEHQRLAEEHNGRDLWGYTEGRAISYRELSVGDTSSPSDDWLWEGGSRSGVAPSDGEDGAKQYLPPWLSPGSTENLSAPGGTAQV
jgi:hypothetical protein